MAAGGRSTRFALDAMLGSLARKLRAFGFDTAYVTSLDDAAILSTCSRQGRLLLTADRQLVASASRRELPAFLVVGQNDRARLLGMIASARAAEIRLKRGEPRCSLCNGRLLSKGVGAKVKVPESVARRHKTVYVCARCGQVYWKGGHWKKLRRLEVLFERQP